MDHKIDIEKKLSPNKIQHEDKHKYLQPPFPLSVYISVFPQTLEPVRGISDPWGEDCTQSCGIKRLWDSMQLSLYVSK